MSTIRRNGPVVITALVLLLYPLLPGVEASLFQASGMSVAGQDSRMNNITVDGSYFNNSFGLGNTPGDRTGVAPISPQSARRELSRRSPTQRPSASLQRIRPSKPTSLLAI